MFWVHVGHIQFQYIYTNFQSFNGKNKHTQNTQMLKQG